MVSTSAFFASMAVAAAAVGVDARTPAIDRPWDSFSAARVLGDLGVVPMAGMGARESSAGNLPVGFLHGAPFPLAARSGSLMRGRFLAAPDWAPTFLTTKCAAKLGESPSTSGEDPGYCTDKENLIDYTVLNAMDDCSPNASATNAQCKELSEYFDYVQCFYTTIYQEMYTDKTEDTLQSVYGDYCNSEEIIGIALAASSTSTYVKDFTDMVKGWCPSNDPADMTTWNPCLQAGGDADFAAAIKAIETALTPLETAFEAKILKVPPAYETLSSSCQEAWKREMTDGNLATAYFFTGVEDWDAYSSRDIEANCGSKELNANEKLALDITYYCDSTGSTDTCVSSRQELIAKFLDYTECTLVTATTSVIAYLTLALEKNNVDGCSQDDEDKVLAASKEGITKILSDNVDSLYEGMKKSISECGSTVHPCFKDGGPFDAAVLDARKDAVKDSTAQAASPGMLYTAFAAISIATISTML